MEFDNKQFEAGIQQSLTSLDNLKKGLDLKGASDGLKNVEKAVNGFDVSRMNASVDSIAQHFTWIGRTIDHELDRITSKAIAAGEQMLKSLTIDQIGSGWNKYESKTKSVATIMNATGKTVDQVNSSLQKLNWFTDETSYNFTDMVNNVGKFTSVGVDLDDAVTAMEGIANAAALSGGGVNEASRAMYNFSQAMGTGKLLLQDWKSIELANMATTDFKNALIESGLAMGTLVKQGEGYITTTKDGTGAVASFTDANEGFRDSLSSGWITTEVMMDTFKKYGEYADEIYRIAEEEGITAAEAMEKFSDSSMNLGERAFKAAQEARTFTDAIEATKDAVSTGWMQSFEIIFGNYEQAKEMWTDLANTLWDVFAGGAEARNELLSEVFQNSKEFVTSEDWASLSKELPMGEAFEKAIMETARAHGIAIDEMIAEEGSFAATLDKSWLTVNLLNETLGKTYDSSSSASEGIDNSTERLENLNKVAQEVIQGKYGNGEKRIKALTEAGYDYAEVQAAVNKILKGGALTYEDLSDAELKKMGYTDEEIAQLNELKQKAEESGTSLNTLLTEVSRPSGRALMIESVSNAFNALMSVIGSIKEAWKNIFPPMTADRLYSIIEGVRNFSKNLIPTEETSERLTRIFSGLFGVLSIFAQGISAIIKGLVRVGVFLKPVGDWLLEAGAKIGDAFTALANGLKESEGLSKIIDGILDVFSAFWEKLKEIWDIIFKSFDISGVLSPIKSKWEEFRSWLVSNGGVAGVISSFFELITNWVKGIDVTKIAGAIKTFIDDLKTRFSGITNVVDFVKEIFSIALNYFKGLPSKFSESFTRFSTIISDWIKGIFGGVSEGLSGAGSVFTKVKEAFGKGIEFVGEILDKGVTLLQEKIEPFVEFIRNIVLIKILSNIGKFITSFGKVFDSIGDTIGSVGKIIESASSFIDKFGSSLSDSIGKLTEAKVKEMKADRILKVAAAIGILVAAVFVLTNVVDPTRIYDALTVLGVLFVELAAGMFLLDKAMGSGGAKGVKKISGFLGLALGLLVLVKVISKLGNMDPNILNAGLDYLAILAVGLAAFTRLVNKDFKMSNGAALLSTALSLQLFILAMLEIAHMKPENAVKGLVGVGALLTEVGIFTRLISKNLKFSNGLALASIGVSLQLFVLAMLEIAKMKPKTIVKGLTGLGLLLTEIGVFTRIASKNIKFTNGMSLIGVATSLLIFSQVLKKIGSLNPDVLAKGLIGLGAAMLEISLLTRSMSKMSVSSGIGSLIGMASLLVLIPLLKSISKIPNIGEVGTSFGLAVAGLGIGLKALSSVGISGGFSAAGALLSFVGTIAVVVAVVEAVAGLIAKIEGAGEFLDGATEILTKVGEGIGGFIGGIAGGAMTGMGEGLENIGTSLSNFWTNASGFIEGVKGVKSEDFSGIDVLSTTVLKLTASEFLDALTSLVGGGEQNLATFGTQLETLGPALATFSTNAQSVDSGAVQNAADALAAIANIEIPAEGGFLQKIIGEKNFSSFGTQLASLGPNLAQFANDVSGVSDYSPIETAAKALASLVAVEIPTYGGFIDFIVGRTDWDIFGQQLASFGPSFKIFSDSVNGIQTSGISDAAKALGDLMSINIPTTTPGLVQLFTGQTEWDVFGGQLKEFGIGFKKFASSMEGVTPESLSGVDPAITSMNKILQMDVPKSGGFFQWLTGKKSLGDFGDNLGKIGEGFGTFNTNVGEVNIENLTSIVGLIERLGTFAGSISGTIVEDIQNFATAMSMIGAGDIDMSSALTAISDLTTNFTTAGQGLADAVITGINTNITSGSDSITSNTTAIANAIIALYSTFTEAGKTLGASFISGLKSKNSEAVSAGKVLAQSASRGMKNGYSDAKSAGANLASGFVAGINSKKSSVTSAATGLANAANSAFRNTLIIESPSKVMAQNGVYFVLGFVNALNSEQNTIASASSALADSAITSFGNAFSLINSIANDSLDLQPRIRPVVDLTNVKENAQTINSIFSSQRTIGLGGYNNPFIPNVLSQIGSNMSRYGMTGNSVLVDNSDVIQALYDLGEEFNTIKDAIANMKLVMQNGALVGQIKNEMDKQLGINYLMRVRGV